MKRLFLVTTTAIGAGLLAAPAWAATCDFDPLTGLAFSPDYSAAFVAFNDFTASVGDAATCGLSVDLTDGGGNYIPPGTVIAYSADYRGSLDPTSTASYSVTNSGLTTSGTVSADPANPPPNNVEFSNIVGTNGTTLDSDIDLAMLNYDDPANAFTLETIDYNELGRTTIDALQDTADQFSADHTALITHLNATGDLLTGAGQPFDAPDGFTALGGVGSFTVGVTGRRTLDDGFTLLGGAAVFDQSAGGASAAGLLASGSLRYATPAGGFVRPYVEAGLLTAPVMALSFTRSYDTTLLTTTTTHTVSGSGLGGLYGGYIRGGAVLSPDDMNQVVLSATLAKDWLLTGDYSETLDSSNFFALSADAQNSSFDTIKLGADWTTKLTPQVDVTLSGAVGRTIAETAVNSDIAFAGSFSSAPVSEMFAEYGARVAYDLSDTQTVGGFIHGSTGQVSGTHVQIGGDFHVNF